MIYKYKRHSIQNTNKKDIAGQSACEIPKKKLPLPQYQRLCDYHHKAYVLCTLYSERCGIPGVPGNAATAVIN